MTKQVRRGRWSDLRTKFLEENRPEELKRMKADGTLSDYLTSIEEEYTERFRRMEEQRLKACRLEERYGAGKMDWIAYVGQYNQIRSEVAELLADELCQ